MSVTTDELDEIRSLAGPIEDLDQLLERVGGARFVLLGEASHGTSEFYRWRARLTRRLIEERGFDFVAVEGDWPDCFLVNRWVNGRAGRRHSAREMLLDFERWPTWMWANEEVAEFTQWLRDHNLRHGARVGFYGLDVYSLWESLQRVLDYLTDVDPQALDAARAALRCFEPYTEDPQRYAWASRMVPSRCENEVVDLLVEMHRRRHVDEVDAEAEFDAMQNAEVLVGAERYYRAMVRADGASWNIRDCHMADTLDRLVAHHGREAKAVVWAHNTHVGDARATDMANAGMVNLGQLARERHHAEGVVLVGFGSHHGTVIAAPQWGTRARPMTAPPPPDGMHEHLLHLATDGDDALLVFPERRDTPWLARRRGHRAIGVVYDPRRDPFGNWVPTVIGQRYDAFFCFEETNALHPLHDIPELGAGELETYPWSD